MKKTIINANGTDIRVYGDIVNENAFICLTDIAKAKETLEPRIVISNWMSSYATIDFLALWESLYNPNFNRMEFHTVRSESGKVWWHICPYRYSFRVCFLDFTRV